jgi:hypothetical protein
MTATHSPPFLYFFISGRTQFFNEVYHSNRFAVCTGTFMARTPRTRTEDPPTDNPDRIP